MKLSIKSILILLSLIGLLSLSSAIAGEGEGVVELGYVSIDETGDESLNHETFNDYDGFSFSLRDFSYLFDNGVRARADFNNISLNNRNLRASVTKQGLFSLSLNNSQYRRIYSSDGERFTRRRTTGSKLRVQLHKNVAVFGGYSQADRHGEEQYLLGPDRIAITNLTDYTQTNLSFGSEFRSPKGFLRAEFRKYDLEDKVDGSSDRKATTVNLSLGTKVPKYDWITLLAGYNHRLDELEASNLELKTNQLWGATKLYLPHNMILDYRILFARTDHSSNLVETDNWHNTVSIGKNWTGYGGLKVGYESRIVDDLSNRTESNGLLFAGWYNYRKALQARVRVTSRSKTVESGVTLLGDEDFTRHLVSVKYLMPQYGTVAASWSGRIRKNEDINSKSDYDVLSSQLDLKRGKYGHFSTTYSYYLGSFENSSEAVTYEFSDHMVTGTYYPPSYHDVELSVGGSYYRSRRDHDLEKFDIMVGAAWTFRADHALEVSYHTYNFDDYRINGAYYTSNVIEAKLIKDLKL